MDSRPPNPAPLPSRLLGLGSPHGDDVAGWLVIDGLVNQIGDRVACRRLSAPHQVLDHCDGVESLHLVDAYDASDGPLPESRWEVAALSVGDSQWLSLPPLIKQVSASTHATDLLETLQLARRLDRLPRRVVLWLIPGDQFEPGTSLSVACRRATEDCIARIAEELRCA